MRTIFRYILLLCVALTFTTCYKAGTGGKASLNIHVFNGNEIVPYATVYVKYNASTWPGTNASYHNEAVCDHSGFALFNKLKKGDYYFYATKYDTASGAFLEGGAFAPITNRKGEQHIVIDFGEEDPF